MSESHAPSSDKHPSQVSRFYRPELDVLRFLAFLMVFLHHGLFALSGLANQLRESAAFGVCLFFLLSSYLITELLEIEKSKTGKIHLGSFYVRRMLRIWPLYVTLLLIEFLIPHRFAIHNFPAARLAAYLLMFGNWYCYYFGFFFGITLPLWSISVEEQFYVLWPTVRKYLGRNGAIAFSMAMLLLSYIALWLLCHWHREVSVQIWVNSFIQFQFFSTGALLAFVLRGRTLTLGKTARFFMFAAALACIATAQIVFYAKTGTSAPANFRLLAPGYFLVNVACILMLLSVLGASGLGRFKKMIYLGRISYGLYAFHQGGIYLANFLIRSRYHRLASHSALQASVILVVAFGVTTGFAALSYKFFESPILRLKKRFEFVPTRAL